MRAVLSKLQYLPGVLAAHSPDCEGFANSFGVEQGICESWCHSHSACEPIKNSYMVCFECGHVFRSSAEVLKAHNMVVDEINKNAKEVLFPEEKGELHLVPYTTIAELVFCCPFCVHDF